MKLATTFALLVLAIPSFVKGQSAQYAIGKGIGPDDEWILCDDEFCHPTRAACVEDKDNDGDFKCECINGWGGSGRECNEDINECVEDSPCPSEGGFCVNRGPWETEFPLYKCGCITGYVETGRDEHGATGCEPETSPTDAPVSINPCDDNDCCDEETCVVIDSGSGYECQCNRDDLLCCIPEQNEIPEPCDGQCDDEGQVCDEHSGLCACIEGYFQPSGLGGQCHPEDECNNGNHNCDRNAYCLDKTPGYKCVCKEGYEGAGFADTCEDIDECMDDTLYDCPSGEICINTNGGYRCGLPPTAKPTRNPTRSPWTNAPIIPTFAPITPA